MRSAYLDTFPSEIFKYDQLEVLFVTQRIYSGISDSMRAVLKKRLRTLYIEYVLPPELEFFWLYFDNKQPAGSYREMNTDSTYYETFLSYYRRKEEYIENYSKGLSGIEKQDAINEMETFFEVDIKRGWKAFGGTRRGFRRLVHGIL